MYIIILKRGSGYPIDLEYFAAGPIMQSGSAGKRMLGKAESYSTKDGFVILNLVVY